MSVCSATTKHSETKLKGFLEFDDAASADCTEQCTVSSDECSEEPSVPLVRKVRFATSRGRDICRIKFIEKHTDPDLWWQGEEIGDIRHECGRLLDAERRDPRGLRASTIRYLKNAKKNPSSEPASELLQKMNECSDLRGLELYVVPECKKSSEKHFKTIVEMQVMKVDGNLLKVASSTRSRLFNGLAIQRAKYDETEATKALQTPWIAEEAAVPLD